MSAPGELPSHFGRYRILRELGKGGMGAVYLAEDPKLNRRVALKVPRFDAADGPQALQRFLREAQIVAGIRHEHICLVHDLDQSGDTHFIVMEYVEGTPLAQWLGRPWKPRAAVELIRKVAQAVHVLHTHGVIHRDLKPGNILIRPSGEPVLLDFGLARPTAPQDLGLTPAGVLLGTPLYMSPEQALTKKDIGPTTDIYSLGVILYEMLTGRRPFLGTSFIELGTQIVSGKLEPPSQFCTGLDGELDTVCLKALAREPAERFTAKELAAALTAYLQPRGAAPERTESVSAPEQVTVVCPACRVQLCAPPTIIGQTSVCPRCKAPFVVTLPPEIVTVPPAPRPSDTVVLDLDSDVTMTFMHIPAAGRKFCMGSPHSEKGRDFDEGQCEVEFSRDFWMAIHETTQIQYTTIMRWPKATPSYFAATGAGKDKVVNLDTRVFPVESVSWEECIACVEDMNSFFAAKLAKKLGARKLVFGLPTEAEWEYACRGGATEKASLPFHFKDGPIASLSSTQANFDGNFPYGSAAKGPYLERTTKVGSYEPNRFGLYDLHGNVWEWCADQYGGYGLLGGLDPEYTCRWSDGFRVVRGGSWDGYGYYCRAAFRYRYAPCTRLSSLGFRLVFRLTL